jgi:hypothetical protein
MMRDVLTAVRAFRRGTICVRFTLGRQLAIPKEFAMLRIASLAAAASALASSTALADFYVVQEKSTKKCKIVETKPTETTWIQVGRLAFKTREEADRQIKVVCKK